MARSNNVSFAVLLFLGIMLIASPILAIENEDESAEVEYIDNENLAASPESSMEILPGFLKNCANTISKPTGDKVFDYIFGDEKSLDYDTCSEVTGSGFLKNCANMISKPTGDKVFDYIFGDEKSLDYDTCSEVKGSGKE
ncbi:hypothetical protein POTOM_053430 [Populus tomentosa]|uniref:Prolamin-like domain-containing protein n=1 Tax=Populus tomentosa TaxID=118781 RepID=A0A8X7XY37_POPTO|nr:hypothetical protein POTOM_053430 [Populus tomentosa]